MSINGPEVSVAFVLPSLAKTFAAADGSSSLTSAPAFSQCALTSPQRFATAEFAELFPSAFKAHTVAGSGITAQNILGLVYNSETGYYNPSLPGSMATSGLADFGTRLKAVFHNIPAGVTLYTSTGPVTFAAGVPHAVTPGNPLLQLNAGLTGTETGTYAPVPSTITLDGIPAAALQTVNGTATAIWEVTGANPLVGETFNFPLWIGYPGATAGSATVNASYAPTSPAFDASGGHVARDSTFPIPRFLDTSTASTIFSIVNPFTLTGTSANFSSAAANASFGVNISDESSAGPPFPTHPS